MIKRRSVIVVISDFLCDIEDILAGLDHLRFEGHNVVVLHTLDPFELDFEHSIDLVACLKTLRPQCFGLGESAQNLAQRLGHIVQNA